ncbi:MAG: hypothetical protein K6F53_00900 [Lachnospiraceae bacterium]|nr:hypothetical protein [Lachnospiraceae bacterium]
MSEFEKERFGKRKTEKYAGDSLMDEELKDRGKLIRIIALVAVAVLLLGIIGTISIVHVTYEGKKEEEDLSAMAEPIEELPGAEDDTIAQLEEVQKYLDYIGSSVDENSDTLNTLYKDQESLKETNNITKEFRTEVGKDISSLSERFKALDQEIASLKKEVSKMISDLKSGDETASQEYLKNFSNITNRVNELKNSYTASTGEITRLIEKLEKNGESRYDKLVAELGTLKKGMEEGDTKGIRSLTDLLDKINSGLNKQLTAVSTDMQSGFRNVSDDMGDGFDETNENIKSGFDKIDSKVDQSIENLAVSLKQEIRNMNGDNTEVLSLLSGLSTDLNNYADTVNRSFTSVANGKQKLSSALATKYNEMGLGQASGSDPSTPLTPEGGFDDFEAAIMRIRAGDKVLPIPDRGEIVFVYHHHSTEEIGSADSEEESGGAYPDDHISDHSGGCFTKEVKHTHTGSPKTGGGCYGESYTYYGTHTCGGTIVPYDQNVEGYICQKCGKGYTYSQIGGDCTAQIRDDTPTTGYRLNCGKSNATEGYACGCGCHEGQMVSAYIRYVDY